MISACRWPAPPAPAPAPAAASHDDTGNKSASCDDDWTKCKDNADLVNNNSEAQIDACQDQVAEQARYGDPKWCSGWFCQKFGKFRVGGDAPKTGVLVLIDGMLQLQNGFGAYAHVTATCIYDLKKKTVIDLAIDQQ